MIEIVPNWHPVFVHFTVAMLQLSAVFYLASFLRGGSWAGLFLPVARINLIVGVAVTVATVIAGFYAYNSVQHDDPSHAAMTDHRNWALVTAVLWTLVAIWEGWRARRSRGRSLLVAITLLIGAGLLGTTGFKGGELVFVYGLGVQSLPNMDRHQHPGGAGSSHGRETGMDGHAGNGHDNGHEGASGGHAHEIAAKTNGHGHGSDKHIRPPVAEADKPSRYTMSVPVPAADKTHVHRDGSSHTH